jgi:hypothetical protein
MSMSEKGEVVAELSDEKRLPDMVSLRDIRHHVNYLNSKHESQQKHIPDMFGVIRDLRLS